MAANKVKTRLDDLQSQIRKLAERFDKEKEKQIAQLESQLDKARQRVSDEMNRRRERLNRLEKLQADYRDKASSTVQRQVDRARKAVDDARQRVDDSQARKRILETEVRVLKATAKQASGLAKVISQYEKDLEKRARDIEKRVTPKKAAKKAATKSIPLKFIPTPAAIHKGLGTPFVARKDKFTIRIFCIKQTQHLISTNINFFR